MGNRSTRTAAALGVLAAALVCASASGAGLGPGRDHDGERAAQRSGRLIVRLQTPVALAPVSAAKRSHLRDRARRQAAKLDARPGIRARDPVPALGAVAVSPVAGETLAELRARLAADPLVQSVETEYLRTPRLVPDDPGYGFADSHVPFSDAGQWNLRDENFQRAWSYSKGGNATVAVIDTGIDPTHPDLVGKIDASVDQGGTGIADHLGHGTHVAGLACADTDNGAGIASAGFNCRLRIEQASTWNGVYVDCCADQDIAEAIVDATDQGAGVINISLGGDFPNTTTEDAIDYAWQHDVVVVAAGSNDPTTNQGFPARYLQPTGSAPTLSKGKGLVVTAAQYNRDRADFGDTPSGNGCGTGTGAGCGTGVSVAAFGDSVAYAGNPGASGCGILSTWPLSGPGAPSCGQPLLIGGDSGYAYEFGTSMSTPQVSGLAALIRSRKPGLSAARVNKLIKATADGGGRWGDQLGWGIIDAGTAVAAALGKDVTRPRSRTKSPRVSHAATFTVKLKAHDVKLPGVHSAGIRRVSVFVATPGKAFHLVRKTRAGPISFSGKPGKTYRFFSIAIDRAGNIERAPGGPDSKTRVAGS